MPSVPELVRFADDFLRTPEVADWDNALNGLQIENSERVTRIGATVDASTRTLRAAAERKIDFLIVHHGLFWEGLQPVTRTLYRQVKLAFENDIALYSAHLPLDLHPEIGNNVLLARALGLEAAEPFHETKGQLIGRKARASLRRDDLLVKLERSLGTPAHCIAAGPNETRVIGIVTGGAGADIYAVAAAGVDTFVTGEAPHWAAVAAEELGMNLVLGGHYATETFGVKALAARLSEQFQIPWEFIDHPTGL